MKIKNNNNINISYCSEELLTRVLTNMRGGIPVENIRETLLSECVSEYSVYLAVKGAQIIMKSDDV